VIGVKKLSNNVRLVKCRNPWGKDSWKGDWGSDSKLWTPKLIEEIGEKQSAHDGIIWLTHDEYKEHFKETHINYNTDHMHQSYFMKLDDDTPVTT